MPDDRSIDEAKQVTARIAQSIPAVADAADRVLAKLELGLEVETLTLRPASKVPPDDDRKHGKATTTVESSGGNTTVTTNYAGYTVVTTCGPAASPTGGAGCSTTTYSMGRIQVIRQR